MQKTEDMKKTTPDYVSSASIGAIVGVIIDLLILYLAAGMVSNGVVSENKSSYFVLGGALLGATIAGWVAGKRQKKEFHLIGSITGCIFFVCMVLIGAICDRDIAFGAMTIKLIICAMMGGILGGTICARPKKRKKNRKRK